MKLNRIINDWSNLFWTLLIWGQCNNNNLESFHQNYWFESTVSKEIVVGLLDTGVNNPLNA